MLADNVFMLTDGHFGLRALADKLKCLADSILRFSLRGCYGYGSDLVIRTQLVKADISIGHMTIFGKF